MKSMPRPGDDAGGLPLQLTRNAAGQIEAQIEQAGDYELKLADGKTRALSVPIVAAPLEISWAVGSEFRAGLGRVRQRLRSRNSPTGRSDPRTASSFSPARPRIARRLSCQHLRFQISNHKSSWT
jgi:hypothetical protein